MNNQTKLSIYISRILRHQPELLNLEMDQHGWVDVQSLINGINEKSRFHITREELERIVAEDQKGRYRFSEDGTQIKACQGHSVSWVEPELEYPEPPRYLYHGTNQKSWEGIQKTGFISKMNRHAVHMHAEEEMAWRSACRWKHSRPVLLKISAAELYAAGAKIGKTENDVWCTECVPVKYVADVIETRF